MTTGRNKVSSLIQQFFILRQIISNCSIFSCFMRVVKNFMHGKLLEEVFAEWSTL